MTEKTKHNSRFTARNFALVLVLIGLLISGYLSYTELTDTPIICTEGEAFSCSAVQQSTWSKFMGIPVAYLGFAGYLLIALLIVFEEQNDFLEDNARLIIFAIGLIGSNAGAAHFITSLHDLVGSVIDLRPDIWGEIFNLSLRVD